MVGGDPQAFAAVQPLLRELGQTVTHIGPSGQGLLLKLAINISLAVQTLAFSEGLLLAERGGVDAELAAEVMSTSSIGSPMLKARIPLLLHLPEHAWFDVDLMQKDIRLARHAAYELAIPLPSAAVADGMAGPTAQIGSCRSGARSARAHHRERCEHDRGINDCDATREAGALSGEVMPARWRGGTSSSAQPGARRISQRAPPPRREAGVIARRRRRGHSRVTGGDLVAQPDRRFGVTTWRGGGETAAGLAGTIDASVHGIAPRRDRGWAGAAPAWPGSRDRRPQASLRGSGAISTRPASRPMRWVCAGSGRSRLA